MMRTSANCVRNVIVKHYRTVFAQRLIRTWMLITEHRTSRRRHRQPIQNETNSVGMLLWARNLYIARVSIVRKQSLVR